jgi:hypothetical protein
VGRFEYTRDAYEQSVSVVAIRALSCSPRRRPVSKTLAVVQSNYIPWKGYFDLINSVDEFVLFDDVQYTRRDWRNRNLIKAPTGPVWLSIPVKSKGNYLAPIKDIRVSDPAWARRHYALLGEHYRHAPHFKRYSEMFAELYLGSSEDRLSAINHRFIVAICEVLGIRTPLTWSMDYGLDATQTDKNRRLVDLCRRAGATSYLSGPTARGYIDEDLFAREGLELRFMDYEGYREYPQPHPPFDHRVSVVDLLFSVGPDAPGYMLSFR